MRHSAARACWTVRHDLRRRAKRSTDEKFKEREAARKRQFRARAKISAGLAAASSAPVAAQ